MAVSYRRDLFREQKPSIAGASNALPQGKPERTTLTARLSASDPARTSVTIQLYPKQLPAGEQHLTDHATYL